MAFRPIRCCIGPDPEKPVLDNHFAYQRVPIEEAGTCVDQRRLASEAQAET